MTLGRADHGRGAPPYLKNKGTNCPVIDFVDQ
jgi:hypothetical protein